MAKKILVVDDVKTNARILTAMLEGEYYDVRSCASAKEAEEIASEGWPDLIVLDLFLPDGDGAKLCEKLKSSDKSQHVPIIIATSSESKEKRIEALSYGADDYLIKPVEPLALFTRVKALFRLQGMMAEVFRQANASKELGLDNEIPNFNEVDSQKARIMMISDNTSDIDALSDELQSQKSRVLSTPPDEVAEVATSFQPEVICLQLDSSKFDALRIVSQIRTLEDTADTALIVIGKEADEKKLARALDMGVNDYQFDSSSAEELSIRVSTLVRRSRYTKKLREHFHSNLKAAVTDQLTGLYNRVYMMRNLEKLIQQADEQGSEIALLMMDIDHFKYVNDTWGHQAGDQILEEFANRLRESIRACDTACRYGGEEFVAIMPNAGNNVRRMIAERLRSDVSSRPFIISGGAEVHVTVSVGAAAYPNSLVDDGTDLLHQADLALYEAKRTGRNRVVDQTAA